MKSDIIIKFKLIEEDVLINQLYRASVTKSIIKRRRFYRILVPILYLLLSTIQFLSGDIDVPIIFIIIAIIWFLFYPRYSKRRYRKYYINWIKENSSGVLDREVTIGLNEEKLTISDEMKETTMLLEEVNSIVEIKNHFLLGLLSGGYIIIPKIDIEGDVTTLIEQLSHVRSLEIKKSLDWQWK